MSEKGKMRVKIGFWGKNGSIRAILRRKMRVSNTKPHKKIKIA